MIVTTKICILNINMNAKFVLESRDDSKNKFMQDVVQIMQKMANFIILPVGTETFRPERHFPRVISSRFQQPPSTEKLAALRTIRPLILILINKSFFQMSNAHRALYFYLLYFPQWLLLNVHNKSSITI